jgi:hypothetical protein
MSGGFVKELRGDTRGVAIDIYNHIDKKELRESYRVHIPQLEQAFGRRRPIIILGYFSLSFPKRSSLHRKSMC